MQVMIKSHRQQGSNHKKMFQRAPLVQFIVLLALTGAQKYRIDRDTANDCDDRLGTCRSSPNTFLECPISCATALAPPQLMVQGIADQRDRFYQFQFPLADGSMLDFDRFDGYITIIAALPMLPGMAQHYYEMAEFLVEREPYRTACLILPFYSTEPGVTSSDAELQLVNRPKCHILPSFRSERLRDHPMIDYIDSVRRRMDPPFVTLNDRTTMYMVNHDGHLHERRVTPTLDKMLKVLQHYYDIMDREL